MSDKNEELFMEEDGHSDRDLEENREKYDESSDGEDGGEGEGEGEEEAASTFCSRQWPQSYRYCSI